MDTDDQPEIMCYATVVFLSIACAGEVVRSRDSGEAFLIREARRDRTPISS